MKNVHASSHPVLQHKIAIMRSSETPAGQFRSVLREVTYHLGYEATAQLSTKPISVTVPYKSNDDDDHHEEITCAKLADRVALIPILRSGLGMTEPMLELLPNARVHHIGMYKKAGQTLPVQYYNRLPRKCQADVAYVLDPIIATASTTMSVVGILRKWGVPKIHVLSVIASKEGLEKLMAAHPDIHVTTGTMDEKLDADGACVPGLGDAGDRLFNSDAPVDNDDEALVHPSKKKQKRTIVEPDPPMEEA